MAGPILKGETFAADASVTNEKLHDLVEDALFKGTDGNGVSFTASTGGDLGTCVAAGGLEVHSDGQLQIKDDGVTTAKIADDAITAATIAAGALTDVVYPIGSIFTTVTNYANSAAVVSAIGGTTWVAFGAGKVLVGQDSSDADFDTAEETGGAKTKALEFANMPAHSHQWYDLGGSSGKCIDGTNFASSRSWDSSGNFSNINDPLDDNDFYTNTATDRSANGSAFSIVQPYIVVYMWKRTA